MLDEDEEEVVYLEHGMGFDSSSPLAKSSGKGLRNQLSLTEAEYLEAQKRARHHQDAPKFRRDGKSKSHGHLPKQQHKSVTLPGDLMVNNSQDLSQCDSNEDDDLAFGMSHSVDHIDFEHYTATRQRTSPISKSTIHNKSSKSRSPVTVLNMRGKRSRGAHTVLNIDEDDELDRPAHWKRRNTGQTKPRRARMHSGDKPFSQKSPREGDRHHDHSVGKVTVSKPFLASVADKISQRHRDKCKSKEGDTFNTGALSFHPSWLLSTSSSGKKAKEKSKPVDVIESVASQNFDHDSDRTESGENGQRTHGDDRRSATPEATASYDTSFYPQSGLIPKVSSLSSPYSSDPETKRKNTSRRSKAAKNIKNCDGDILPKYLRARRLESELEIRFETALKQSGKCKQRSRNGDLQDPRRRTKRFVDVIVRPHHRAYTSTHHNSINHTSNESNGDQIFLEHPPFVVLALKVVRFSAVTMKSDSNCIGSGSDVIETNSTVFGYFKPETFSKMDVCVVAGKKLRIYDFVMIPSTCHWSKASSDLEDSPISGSLMCTSLCESLSQ